MSKRAKKYNQEQDNDWKLISSLFACLSALCRTTSSSSMKKSMTASFRAFSRPNSSVCWSNVIRRKLRGNFH